MIQANASLILDRRRALALLGVGALGVAMAGCASQTDAAEIAPLYEDPAPAPAASGRKVFHLGHSLVGRDMPAMLAQLGGSGHRYDSQLGWGTSLRQHWNGKAEIAGFDSENAHPRYRDAGTAIDSGEYDAVVLTEMVEIRDAIRYHDTARFLRAWADRARDARPDVAIYLYETWHNTDGEEDWFERIDADLGRYWIGDIIAPVVSETKRPIYLIPGGQALAAVARTIPDIALPDLFAIASDGKPDTIHLGDLGHYVIAATHFAVLYQRDPTGLPLALRRADGSPARYFPPEIGRAVQSLVWDVVLRHPMSGVPDALSDHTKA